MEKYKEACKDLHMIFIEFISLTMWLQTLGHLLLASWFSR